MGLLLIASTILSAGNATASSSSRVIYGSHALFRRCRPDRHGRTRSFAGARRRVGAQQIGDLLEGGEHALVLVGGRRWLGRGNLERRAGTRWQRFDGGDRPRLDVDRGHPTGLDVGGTPLQVGEHPLGKRFALADITVEPA
jgi:hypothetical protein